MPNWKKVIVSGSNAILNSLNVTNGITGSLLGTSSYATQALTASNANTASYVNQLNQSVVISGSLTVSGSTNLVGTTGTTLLSTNADTLTFTGSIFTSGSIVSTGSLNITSVTSSLLGTASYATQALTASYIVLAQTASYVLNAVSSSYTLTASNVQGGTQYYVPLWNTNTSLTNSYLNQSGSVLKTIYSGQDRGLTLDYNFNSFVLGNAGVGNNTYLQVYDGGSVINIYTPNYTYFNDKVGVRIIPTNPGLAVSGSLEVTGPGTTKFINTDVQITGALSVTGGITGSLLGTASYATQALSSSYATTASYVNPLRQKVIVSGSIDFSPTTDPDPTGAITTDTFLFVSASNTTLGNDLYFRQDGNLVKWKWMEGQLQTGLLYGGVLTYSASIGTVYISSGSGIIVNYNATTGSEISPIVSYVNWPSQSLNLTSSVSSSQATYIYINSSGVAQYQDDIYFTNAQYANSIPLGMVNHTGRNTITSVANNSYTSYNTTNQTFDFIESFGPLKVTGLTVSGQTGTLRLDIGAGESFILGGFYQQDPNNISHKTTNAYTTASIARVYRSGSTFNTDNNGGAFYTTIDPTQYDATGTGTLSSVGNNWTIQRAFFNPFTGRVHVYYGQNVYDKLDTAIANLAADSFVEAVYTSHQYVFAAYLIVYGGTNTDLTDTNINKIVQSGLFRNTVGSSGTTIFSNKLANLSDVSISTPTNGQALIYNGGNWVNGNPATASFATSSISSSYATSASYAQTATTAPLYLPLAGGTITGNLTVNGTASISYLDVTFESASIIFSSGSNQLGDASNDTQTLWGSVVMPTGPLTISQSLTINQNTSSLASGTQIISTNSTGSYTSAFYKYTLASGSNARAGEVMVVWNGSTIQYTDVATTDIGNTSNVALTASLNGGSVRLTSTLPSSGWTVKTLVNLL